MAFLSLKLVVNIVGEYKPKRTAAESRGFLVTARLSCKLLGVMFQNKFKFDAHVSFVLKFITKDYIC